MLSVKFRDLSWTCSEHSAMKLPITDISQELNSTRVEAGISHLAEQVLSAHLRTYGEAGILDAVRSKSPAQATAFIQMLGHCANVSSTLRSEIVSWALESTNVQVRDAAVQTAENWADRALIPLLRAHRAKEKIGWLCGYITEVIADIE